MTLARKSTTTWLPLAVEGYGRTVITSEGSEFDTAVLDIDGTLVDSVYSHVRSWHEAFRIFGIEVPAWRVHRAIGMGGDKLVEVVTNDAVERAIGDEVRGAQSELYHELSAHLTPTPGATDLLQALKSRGLKVVLASSGARADTDHAVSLLEARPYLDATISGDDTAASKPDTEPVQRAVETVGGSSALVVGDAVWDMESARRSGHTPVGLLTGGIARCELMDAGAVDVREHPAALVEALGVVLGRHP